MKVISISMIMLLCISLVMIIGFNKLDTRGKIQTIDNRVASVKLKENPVVSTVGEIPVPPNYTRVSIASGSFPAWLRNVKLRRNNKIYLYNGQPKDRQDLHYAVLDISTGDRDLQQCADCIMRLRAEYYFQKKEYDSINFISGSRQYNFVEWKRHNNNAEKDDHNLLLQFMEMVFINCGTYTIEEMTKPVKIKDIEIGDVFIKAGAPGHTMIVMDIALNNIGSKIYLLAEGYMPAQDMHITINPVDEMLNPWYAVNENNKVITPGWVFSNNQLRRF